MHKIQNCMCTQTQVSGRTSALTALADCPPYQQVKYLCNANEQVSTGNMNANCDTLMIAASS